MGRASIQLWNRKALLNTLRDAEPGRRIKRRVVLSLKPFQDRLLGPIIPIIKPVKGRFKGL